MLQELAAQSEGASSWAVASMIFFFVFFLVVSVRVLRTRRDVLEAQARLVLDDEPGAGTRLETGSGPRA